MRVRTTSFILPPAFFKAVSMFLKICTACAYTSPTPTIFPSAPVAVVPETCTFEPTLTAREQPTIGSHVVPLEMLFRSIRFLRYSFYKHRGGTNPRIGSRHLRVPTKYSEFRPRLIFKPRCSNRLAPQPVRKPSTSN